jgi:hypothetical protein
MNSEWSSLLERVHSGAELHKSHPDVVNTICAWHQEQSDLCLILSRKLKVPVSLRLKKHLRDNRMARIDHDADDFVTTKRLRAVFEIPNLSGPVEVIADALRRNIVCVMSVQAPEDKKTYEGRLNWLLRQLPTEITMPIGVHIRWKNGGTSFGSAGELRVDPGIADIDRPGALPKSFDVTTVTDLGRKFASPRSFIDLLEAAAPQFYDNVARYIRGWQPGPVSGPAEGAETLTETVASLPDPKKVPQRVVRRGQVSGGRYSVFEDGSIEVETPSGMRRFKDITELLSYAKPTKDPNAHSPGQAALSLRR